MVALPLILGAASIGAGALEASAARGQANKAAAQQQIAMQAQERASRAAEEDAQLQATGQDASTRIARAAGLHILGFQGASAGAVDSTLGASPKGSASTLGG
jgi:hypothetical protein